MKEKKNSVNTSSNRECLPGTVITGKWRSSRFIIKRILGSGANGTVYLVHKVGHRELYALKMGYDTLDLQSEINVLTSVQSQRKQQDEQEGRIHRPYLLEVDDYSVPSGEIPFYVMRYVKGSPLHRFIKHRGREWLGLVGLRLLEKLRDLHRSGFIFGDLKPENVMVTDYGEVELIDYGGVSSVGRSVKQFTEWYDRGYWNAGSRISDEGYDLFSFAVLCIHILHANGLNGVNASHLPQTRNASDLLALVSRSKELKPYASWLTKAIRGEFTGSHQAFRLWKEQVYKPVNLHKNHSKTTRQLKNAFAISFLILCGAIFLAFRL
uniref:serine/threonine protein kinase n=1 Tax=Paenibacillus sp. IHBB 10380 TaxID=1566358 RepID=UPI0011851F2B|nr:serine/threonine protein kinase [Paenibacillus sp. IHBB 10380]